MNQTLQAKAEEWGVHWATSPAYQPASNGIAERMIGLAKTIVRRLLFAAELESKLLVICFAPWGRRATSSTH